MPEGMTLALVLIGVISVVLIFTILKIGETLKEINSQLGSIRRELEKNKER